MCLTQALAAEGVAIYQDGEEVWSESGGEIETTNNRMELTAIIKALELAHGRPCLIFTDMLCVNTLEASGRRGGRQRVGEKQTEAR